MKILAADTSTSVNSLAVCEDDRILVETIVDCPRAHAERIMNTVDWVLEEANLTLSDLDALAVSVGPGSFTGLRIGVAAFKGLAFATNLQLVPVPTLDAMTHLTPFRDGVVCPVLDARMKQVFGAVFSFESGKRLKLTPDKVCSIEDLVQGLEGKIAFFGDGADAYSERILAKVPDAFLLGGLSSVPRASAVATEAAELLKNGVDTDPARVAPVYLRKSQAEENLQKKAT